MPDLPISGLPTLLAPEPTDVFAIVNGGITKKTTVQAVGNSVFNQISSSVILPSQTGSFGVTPYYGSFYHSASIVASATSTPTTMSLNTTDFAQGVVISGSSHDKIKLLHEGYYNIQFSAQTSKNTGTTSDLYIWLRKNGNDVPWSNTGITMPGGANDVAIPAWNWFVPAAAGDYYQIMWSVVGSTNNTFIEAKTSIGGGPEIPSLIVTVNRIA